MRFLDLGSLQLEVDGDRVTPGGRRPARVLSTLLLHLDHRVSTDVLLDAVWGSHQVSDPAAALETHIWRLRRLLEPHRTRGQAFSVLINDSGGYRLVATGHQVDSARFEQLCLLVVDLLSAGQHERALRTADEALELWRGAPYEEIADRDWAVGPISRLHELRVQLLERRVDCMLDSGQASRAIAELEILVSAHPLRERLWWQRMLALYQTGRVDQALQTYRQARETLRDQLGIEPGPDLAQLHQRILTRDPQLTNPAASRPVPSLRPVEVRLPRGRRLIAREVDHAAVLSALGRSRMVTITGPAGCGKTRLAINVARAAPDRFPDGVCFVDLSDARDLEGVGAAVVSAFSVTVPPGATAETALAAYGRDRQLLVVLDNCEQALDAVATLCDQLLDPDLQLTMLATSREPIGVADEIVHVLEPLAVGGLQTAASPAAALFLERMPAGPDRAPGGTSLSASELDTIDQICRAVGGLPLAIELAAALASAYGLAEIAEMVERNPGQLSAIGRGQARHHQTLASAIERSYRLLTPTEQTLHRRLSVLPAGFSLDLAQTVAAPDIEPDAVPALLARLVHRSLLASTRSDSVSRSDDAARFQQLVPIRSHAAQHLARTSEAEAAERLRDRWTYELVGRRPRAGRPEEREWYQAVTDDLATVRATLQHRLVATSDELGAQIAPQLMGYWFYQGLFAEGRRWAEAALRVQTTPAVALRNHATLSTFLLLQGRNDLARDHVQQALAGLPQVDPSPDLAEFLLMSSAFFASTGDARTARRAVDAARPLVEATGDCDLAMLHEVMSCTADSLVASPADTLTRAEGNYERALAAGNLLAAWMSCSSVNTAALALHDPALGLPSCRRLLELQERLAGRTGKQQLETLADFLALDRRFSAATSVFSTCHHRARRAGAMFPRNTISTELLAECRQQLSVADFDAAWSRGATRPWSELIGDLG